MYTEGASGVFVAILVGIVGAIALSAAGLFVLREQTPLELVTPSATESVATQTETAVASTPTTADPTPATTTQSTTTTVTPIVPASTPTATPELEYVVVAGDGVEVLAARFGIPAAEIIERNNLQPPYTLSIGQVLIIPTDE